MNGKLAGASNQRSYRLTGRAPSWRNRLMVPQYACRVAFDCPVKNGIQAMTDR
jgi:hypothetical protein